MERPLRTAFIEKVAEFLNQGLYPEQLRRLVNIDWNQCEKGVQATEVIQGIVIESSLDIDAIPLLDSLQ